MLQRVSDYQSNEESSLPLVSLAEEQLLGRVSVLLGHFTVVSGGWITKFLDGTHFLNGHTLSWVLPMTSKGCEVLPLIGPVS